MFGRDKQFCRGKHTFVESKDVFRHNKYGFVATKMILVAAPANDRKDASHDERILAIGMVESGTSRDCNSKTIFGASKTDCWVVVTSLPDWNCS